MASKTKVNGTNYKISGGKALVNGTSYKIKGGKTLVDGTTYSVRTSLTFTSLWDWSITSTNAAIKQETTTNGYMYSVWSSIPDFIAYMNLGQSNRVNTMVVDDEYYSVTYDTYSADKGTYWRYLIDGVEPTNISQKYPFAMIFFKDGSTGRVQCRFYSYYAADYQVSLGYIQ